MNKLNIISITKDNFLKVIVMRGIIIVMSLAFLSGIAYAKNEKDWTGFYSGLNAGGIFNAASLNSNNLGFTRPDGTCNTNAYFSSFFPGLQFGYAHQFNRKVVAGLEADYTYNFNKQGNAACTCEVNPGVSDRFVIKNQQQGSLRGRIGYALDNYLLPYLMAGGSLAKVGMNYRNEGGDYYSKNTSTPGWLVGTGLEWRVTHAWSIRAEYYYTVYNNALNMKVPVTYGLYDSNGGAGVNLHTNNIRAAINYWF